MNNQFDQHQCILLQSKQKSEVTRKIGKDMYINPNKHASILTHSLSTLQTFNLISYLHFFNRSALEGLCNMSSSAVTLSELNICTIHVLYIGKPVSKKAHHDIVGCTLTSVQRNAPFICFCMLLIVVST